MPKFPTFPDCFDLVDQVSISSLKKWGYLKPRRRMSGTIVWSRDGRTTGSIAVTVDMIEESVEFDYFRGGERINYRVRLEWLPSNLGNGRVWYFICPVTGRRCRKLYQIGDKFLSRHAFPDAFYSKQIAGGGMTEWRAALDVLLVREKKLKFLSARHARPFHNGEPTRRFRAILKQEEKVIERFSKIKLPVKANHI